jgi:flavorubredoxin
MHPIKFSENTFYLGFNDRRTHLFENIWPLPNGVSYNSYLIFDEKIALIDTVERHFIEDYYKKIEDVIGEKKIDFLIINHMEPDHSGALKAIIGKYPGITLIGNKKTFPIIENFGISSSQIKIVEDNDVLDLGKTKLQFQTIPMVHWPETMVTFDETHGILYSGDAFGSFGTLDGGIFDDEINLEFYEEESMRYFTNIVGKYCAHTQRALKKLASLNVKTIAPTHGPVWRTNLNWILDRYNKWSSYDSEKGVVIVFGSMYGNTEKMAEVIARQLSEKGIRNIRIYDSSKTHPSYIIKDLFKFKGFIVGSCAYNNEMFPNIESLLKKIEHLGIKDRFLGLFGNYLWSGGGVSNLKKFADVIKWDLVYEPVEERGSLNQDQFRKCIELADAMAEKLNHD